MKTLHDAIYILNPEVKSIIQNVAYDKDEQVVQYDIAQAQAKLAELQAAEEAAEQAQATAKASALAKLTALGLTDDEVKALLGA